MENRCEFSSINIPNDPKYAAIAARYVAEIADLIGFLTPELQSINKAVRQAVEALMDYSFEPGENAAMQISCERIPAGLQVTIRDRGVPFDQNALITSQTVPGSKFAKQIKGLFNLMDEVRTQNLGTDGKELILSKHMNNRSIADYYAACDLEPYGDIMEEIQESVRPRQCSVRQMQAADAAEVSKSVYKTYGYSYPLEYIYFPEKIVSLNKRGQIHSAVAVAGGDKIVGHCALQVWHENPQIAEMGQGVVNPEFRSRGCFAQLTAYLLKLAGSKGLLGVFDRAVTNHPYSQQTGHQSGAEDCALLLGHVPLGAEFKSLTGKLSQRGSMVMQFNYLKKPPQKRIYPPAHHKAMIRKLYASLNTDSVLTMSDGRSSMGSDMASIFRVIHIAATKVAHISIQHCGPDIFVEIRNKLKSLCLQKVEVVNVYLNLSEPYTPSLTERFEAMGFFFAGIFPECYPDGDAIILQFLNRVPIDFDKIYVVSETAGQLVDYIKHLDPNRI